MHFAMRVCRRGRSTQTRSIMSPRTVTCVLLLQVRSLRSSSFSVSFFLMLLACRCLLSMRCSRFCTERRSYVGRRARTNSGRRKTRRFSPVEQRQISSLVAAAIRRIPKPNAPSSDERAIDNKSLAPPRHSAARADRHEVDEEIITSSLALRLPYEDPDRLFRTLVNWGRHADLFDHDVERKKLFAEPPPGAASTELRAAES